VTTVRWSVTLCGGLLAVADDGRRIDRFPTRKTAALLAFLALAPSRPHTRERLAALLWPDAEPESARHNLRLTLSRLRACFAPDPILRTDRLTVRLDTDIVQSDIAAFEAALDRGDHARCRALWTALPLADISEDWAAAEQQRLIALYERVPAPPEPQLPHTLPSPALPTAVLPAYRDRFIERADVRERLIVLLGSSSLVTITGPAGVGKTRLAVETLRNGSSLLPHFVSLAEVTHTDDLPAALRSAFHLPDGDSAGSMTTLAGQLGSALRAGERADRDVVLLLDNLEQVDTAPFLEALLSHLPSLRVLATSRRPLGVPGEQLLPLEPLSLAQGQRLFTERARALRPDFGTDHDLAGLERLCAALDGLPLALELAAARTPILSPQEIFTALGQRRLHLTRGLWEGTGTARHRSLEIAIAWSVDLLPDSLQRFFFDLAVFSGGATAAAIGAVVGTDDATTLSALDMLAAYSLVQTQRQGGTTRFVLLATLRSFGQERLSPERSRLLAQRHAHFFEGLVRSACSEAMADPRTQSAHRRCLQTERENLGAALLWTRTHDPGLGMDLGTALWPFWYMQGAITEGIEHLQAVLAQPQEVAPVRRGAALTALASLLQTYGDLAAATRAAAQAVEALEAISPDPRYLWALHQHGLTLLLNGALDAAEEQHRRQEHLAHQLADWRLEAAAWYNLGLIALERTQLDRGDALLQRSLAVFTEHHDPWWCGQIYRLLGWIGEQRGGAMAAREPRDRALALFRESHSLRGEADVLADCAVLALESGEYTHARHLAHEAETLCESLGAIWAATRMRLVQGWATLENQDPGTAQRLAERALIDSQRMERPTGVGLSHHLLGAAALETNDLGSAAHHLDEAGHLYQQIGEQRWLPHLLLLAAELAYRRGSTTWGDEQLGRAETLLTSHRVAAPTQRIWDRVRAHSSPTAVRFSTTRTTR
jgi:predicted ATPase